VFSSPGRRNWALGLLALVLVVATVLVAVTLSRPSRNAANATLPGSPSAEPLSSESASPSASPSPSAWPSPSKSPSASPRKNTGPINPHQANCAPRPSSCGLPDASNTGVPAGTKLTVVPDRVTVTIAGTVIDGKDIRGCVDVKAPRVTIRRSKISCTDFYAIASIGGGGLTVEDSEIDCKNTNNTGLGSYGLTARRLNIHNCENGFDIDNTITVTDSYIHDLFEGSSGHADGIQLAGGAHITISHNTIFNPGGTSAIISNPSANSDVTVTSNLMAGGAYTLYCPRDSSSGYRVIDNRFSPMFSAKSGAYGPWTDCEKVAEVHGNVWDNNLQPLK
jgi:hypothetical protein